ncbi:hypothetical protein AAHA92_32075 [Salvia divinorum]|uniref:Wall-associated receptor kinase galacturonan-binding domain-containing protein n=1 Tax=Salvia divinorum TaxID=28513 RepID=A0ABD1FJI1_SALDI
MITTQKLIIFLVSSPLLLISADPEKCSPSACGAIRNISYPFRLNSDPIHCGRPKFELTCENNVTFLYPKSSTIKYYVKHINYDSSTIRLADASVNNDDICSFPARSSYPYEPYSSDSDYFYSGEEWFVKLISCPNPINNSDINPMNINSSLFIDINPYCASNLSHPRFSYVKVRSIKASELPHMCKFDLIIATTWPGFTYGKNVSLSEIHQSLLYGFDLTFCSGCGFTTTAWEKFRYNLLGPTRKDSHLEF